MSSNALPVNLSWNALLWKADLVSVFEFGSFMSLCQKCFWIHAGLGVRPLLARQFASSRNQAHRTLNWCSAKCVTLSSALLANLIGIQVKAVKRTCQSLFFREKQGKILEKIKYLEAKHSIVEQIGL